MKRTPWGEIVANPSSCHLLVGRLDDSFAGGPDGRYDTHRLRFAVNLMMRCCTGLSLQGTFAVQGSRDGSETQVQLATTEANDFLRLRTVTGSTSGVAPPWKSLATFVLDEALHERLLEFAGAPDNRGAGRRARERVAVEREELSLRWKVSARGGGS
jgi:hypothetical protein